MCQCVALSQSLSQSLDAESDHRKIESLLKVRLCVDAQLLQPELLAPSLQLYVLASRWMRSLLDPTGAGLPLSSRIPMEFASLPEYFIEDIADYMLFLTRFALETIEQVDILPVMHLFVVLIASNAHMNNPYLRAKLVEVFVSLSDNADNPLATSNKQKPKNNLSQLRGAQSCL